MSREPQHRITDLTKRIHSLAQERLRQPVSPPSSTHHMHHISTISDPQSAQMLSGDQESCTPSNSQDFGQTMSTNISPQPPSITAADIAPGQFAINMLLDEVLLEVFACYVQVSQRRDAWHTLACVCRRWRSIAFGSPRRLNLRIFCSDIKLSIFCSPASQWQCSDGKRVRRNLDLWPPFPIVLTSGCFRKLGEDNILATLKHHDRVSHIDIWDIPRSLWGNILPLMQKPFPMLADLSLRCSYTDRDRMAPVDPDLFLGGSATRLRQLRLEYIPFPGLPKLLLSATHLVRIVLDCIPDSGYIAPEALITCISTLTRLRSLKLYLIRPDRALNGKDDGHLHPHALSDSSPLSSFLCSEEAANTWRTL
jgi:hypothetical protein